MAFQKFKPGDKVTVSSTRYGGVGTEYCAAPRRVFAFVAADGADAVVRGEDGDLFITSQLGLRPYLDPRREAIDKASVIVKQAVPAAWAFPFSIGDILNALADAGLLKYD